MTVLRVAAEVFREAVGRRWIIVLGVLVSLALVFIGAFLRLDVVDGALAAVTLFGTPMHDEIASADVVLRPVFRTAAYIVFYGGIGFGIVVCADFAPGLLAPGRIEHLLALPIRRWELVLGTYASVLLLATVGALYGAGGFAIILGVKTGSFSFGPLQAGVLAVAGFACIYAVMLAIATVVSSSSLGAICGWVVFIAGIIAGRRETIASAFDEGTARSVFLVLTAPLPRISTLADMAGDIAAAAVVAPMSIARVVFAMATFAGAALLLGLVQLDRKEI